MKEVSLQRHMLSQHDQHLEPKYVHRTEDSQGTFVIDNYTKGSFNCCPVPQCTGGGKDTHSLYRHFAWIHPQADLVISGDRNVVKCDACGMKTCNLNKHQTSDTCKKLRKRRDNEKKQNLQAEAENAEFRINGKLIEKVHHFKYLGRWLSDNDDDSKCILENLRKARSRWNSIANILKREGANADCMGRFYQVIVQSVLLYGADSWAINNRNMKRLQSFHNRVIRHITGKHICKKGDRWEYPNHEELYKRAKILPIEKYIERRRGTLWRYLQENRPELLEDSKQTKHHCHDPNKILWWNQKFLERKELNSFRSVWLI